MASERVYSSAGCPGVQKDEHGILGHQTCSGVTVLGDAPMLASGLITTKQILFLQAEAGIRYYRVTGVQTCALPISLVAGSSPVDRPPAGDGDTVIVELP